MSKYRITWHDYSGPDGTIVYHMQPWHGTADELRERLSKTPWTDGYYALGVEILPEDADPMDRFRVEYARYSADEFSDTIENGLAIPRASNGFDCPVYGVAYTTTDDGEHELQVSYVPSELVRVYWVDGEEVNVDRFSDLDEISDDLVAYGFEDYIYDCETYGEKAGIITEEG